MDKIELFDVFSSSWFTAIYVLLFVSLIGCLIPRLAEHLRALRSTPVRAPRNLSRLPHHHAAELSADSTAAVERVRAALPRWRLAVRTADDGATELSAEKGYLREAGNLLFHFSLLGLLVAIAVGKLFGYEGPSSSSPMADPDSATHRPQSTTRSRLEMQRTEPVSNLSVSGSTTSPPTI